MNRNIIVAVVLALVAALAFMLGAKSRDGEVKALVVQAEASKRFAEVRHAERKLDEQARMEAEYRATDAAADAALADATKD